MWEKEMSQVEETFIQELQALLRINTEYDERSSSEQHPFGRNIADGLDYIRQKALQDGFEVLEYDERAIAITYGSQPSRIEAVSHLDVVPAGDNWSYPPYGATIVNDMLYGRGTQDMKTQLWLTYTALRMIRSSRIPLKRQLRVVVGTDEERTMQDMIYYLDRAGLPDFAFTPDGRFPLCLGEKGVLVWYLDQVVDTKVLSFHAGKTSNVICDFAVFTVPLGEIHKLQSILRQGAYAYELEIDSKITVHILGKAAHTSSPHLGDNAIMKALQVIALLFQEAWAVQLVEVLKDPYGSGFGLHKDYPPMGFTSVEFNILNIQDSKLHGEIDVRFPTPLTSSELTQAIQAALTLFDVFPVYEEPIISTDITNPFVQILLDNYRKHFPADQSEPYISGGVTYSKVYHGRCVSYGSRLPFEQLPELAHQTDEHISLHYINDLCKLYASAFVALANCEE